MSPWLTQQGIKRTRIRSVRSSHWTTIKRETGSWFYRMLRGFLVCLKQQTLSEAKIFLLPYLRTWNCGSKWNSVFSRGSIYLLWRDCFPRGGQVCIMELWSFIFPKVSLRSLRSWVENPSPHLPSVTRFKDDAEEQGRSYEGTRGMGNRVKQNGLNLKIANYLVSYSSEPWHNDHTIQIFQLKWLYIQASKLTIK